MTSTKTSSPYFVIGLLVFIFMAPLVLALLLYCKDPDWLHRHTLNKGQLLSTPLDLSPLKKYLLASKITMPGSWLVFYLTTTPCDRLCQQRMQLLHRIILALGKNSDKIRAGLFQSPAYTVTNRFASNTHPLHEDCMTGYGYQRFFDHTKIERGYYVVTPAGKIILYYSDNTPGEDLYKDLTRLLVHSEA